MLGLAIKAYQIKGDNTGNKTFDLNTWQSGTGGAWYNWYVSNGIFSEQSGTAINCTTLGIDNPTTSSSIYVYPNPTNDKVIIEINDLFNKEMEINIFNSIGQKFDLKIIRTGNKYIADLSKFDNEVYYLLLREKDGVKQFKKIIKY